MSAEERRSRPGGAVAALLVAAALHGLVGYLLFSSQTLQFTHASAARPSADRGVAVSLVSTARPAAAQAATPTPPAARPTPSEHRKPSPTTNAARSASTRRPTLAEAPSSQPPPMQSSTSFASAATTSAPAESVPPARTEPGPPTAAPSAQAPTPMLPGAAVASSNALACQVPQPPYPPRARRLRQAGTVLLRLTVTATGSVTGAEVATTSGSESLDRAALDAVSAARCKPGLTDGVANAVVVAVPVYFSLLN